ncbi:HAMP domain-containing protein [Patescibacteria group bacterium]|nr:HAMP domain-containing protein [Patescibacteria group bacterium]MBU4367516.1 HAMP domain-containing protein [Patescibacteria group bacterium]MBU4461557.1 HAMP domain-containing protein [Patescibacteria group bacterium]MCG2699454.1 HAMP domain-containing protein [Candidatus Parcubacteria bacterium]
MKTSKKILFKVSFPIIIIGIFVMVVFTALNYENLNIEVYAIFALIAVFVFLFGFSIGQKFSSPVRQLLDKAEKLSRGELNSRIYLGTKDEFGELAKAFNKIAGELEQSHQTAEKAEDVADVRVRARTQELEEEINNLEQKVKGRALELQKIIEESEQLQELVKNREVEIIKLKKEIKDLAGKQNRKNTGKKSSI